MAAEATSFRCRVVRALRRRDFCGDHIIATITGDGITLRGQGRGFLHVPLDRVDRLRAGFTESKYGPIHETNVWLEGEREPLRIFPYDRTDDRSYSTGIRMLAAALAERGKLGRVERGLSTFEALFGPALMAPVVLLALAGAAVAADPPVWWHFFAIPFIPATVFGVLVWRAVTRHMPRAVGSLQELEVQLPVKL